MIFEFDTNTLSILSSSDTGTGTGTLLTEQECHSVPANEKKKTKFILICDKSNFN